jgi:type IV secretion system protein VirB10
LLNSISTKTVVVGDPVYLQTAFPVVIGGKIVIPPGSYVKGSVTGVKRAGKVKGRSELYVRFDALTLPNGVTRDFRSRPGSVDASARGQMEREEGKVKGEGNKTGDAVKTGEAAAWGTMIGGVAGQSAMGAGIGAAAGAAAGLVGVLLTRGPDVVLEGGTTIEMVLDRNLRFSEKELSPPAGSPLMPGSPPTAQPAGGGWGRRP